ncbi:MAG: iron-containing alcohol dehydrogenase family protein [Halobacteriota archaeon]|uniref:iron-containing alcohol dehydrogenase family protein n=1 Tax=Natronomonas sp. TaxID=2184060 RepID=UPI0039758357
MTLDVPEFTHGYRPGTIHFGRGCISSIGDRLSERGCERSLVVCGRNVGANRELIEPLESGLDGTEVEVFDETTPQKRMETVYEGVDRLREVDADAIVAVGSGSSLDVARFMRLLDGDFRPLDALREEIDANGTPSVPEDDELIPMYAVPTTFAGADLSVAAAVTYPTADGGRAETIPVGNGLMPTELFYDSALFETTPMSVLAGSAFNGFDKALEMVYSAFANPITDAAAVRSLKYLRSSLPELPTAEEPEIVDRAVAGMILAQYGVSTPERYKCNVVHAFGHGLRNQFGVQQGSAHAVMVPHVLELLFEQVDGRREVLAEGLVVDADERDPGPAVIDAVTEIRDGLGLPSRLRDLDGTSADGLRNAAVLAHEDAFMNIGPAEFDPTVDDIEAILERAW